MELLRWLRQSYDKFEPIATRLFLWIGLALLLFAAISGIPKWRFAHSGVRTTATIIENVPSFEPGGGIHYYPRFRFRDTSGALIQILSPQGSDDPEFTPGDTVPVIYPPGNPQAAIIVSIWRTYHVAILLGVFGIVLFDLGLVLGRLRLQRASQPVTVR